MKYNINDAILGSIQNLTRGEYFQLFYINYYHFNYLQIDIFLNIYFRVVRAIHFVFQNHQQ